MMLLGGRQAEIKQVAIVTRNPQFKKLLSSILAEWKFFTVDDPATASVVFVERGMPLPAEESAVVWLTPLPLAGGNSLVTPISLSSLYHLLETQFFPTPRRHIRVAMEDLLDVRFDDVWLVGRLTSLSERGGRFVCPVEIPRGSALLLEVKLAGKPLRMAAEVLYCIPAGDSPDRPQPQIGVLFKPSTAREFPLLRGFVEKTCVECARIRENISPHDPCLSWLDVPADPWGTR